jgi:hypothetical protein
MSDMEIIILSLTDATGCENSGFEPVNITVLTTPAPPASPAGPEFVDLYLSTQSEYNTTGSPMADSYEWSLEPESAGSLTIDQSGLNLHGRLGTCLYRPGFAERCMGINDCGTGAFSQALAISVGSSFGIADNTAGVGIAIYPNPSSGIFRIELMTDHAIKTTLQDIQRSG